MKRKVHTADHYWLLPQPVGTLFVQSPLPHFLHTLPILVTIEGQESVLAGCALLAPPEEPADD